MKTQFIKEILNSIGVKIEDIPLGFFDNVGELTAKRQRNPKDDLYNKVGAFYRANYERGILQFYLTQKFGIKSFLEIGTGRGYVTTLIGAAMKFSGIDGKIYTIDNDQNAERNFHALRSTFPYDWFEHSMFLRGTSIDVLKNMSENFNQNFDMIYIDGDHHYETVKFDWEWSRDHFNKFVIFDDYDEKDNELIHVRKLIEEIDKTNEYELDLIKMDRRIFFDDRRIEDKDLNYGQVLLRKK